MNQHISEFKATKNSFHFSDKNDEQLVTQDFRTKIDGIDVTGIIRASGHHVTMIIEYRDKLSMDTLVQIMKQSGIKIGKLYFDYITRHETGCRYYLSNR